MIDVFISFTTRGGTNLDWVVALRNNLKKAYLSNYGVDDLDIWDMSRNAVGEDFTKEISTALENTSMLVLVMDPAFITSPQVKVEINKYQSERAKAGEQSLILKIIKKRGDKDNELKRVVDSNLLVSYFSKLKTSNVEEEFEVGGQEYNDEVQKIVVELRKHKIDQRRKINAQKLSARLEQLKDIPKIFVAFGDTYLTEGRRKFITQLTQTINHHMNETVKQVKIIPDDFTLTQFDYDELSELLCEENEYRQHAIDEMLASSSVAIVEFESDNISEAEAYLNNMRLQVRNLKLCAFDLQKKFPVYILLNLPKELFETEEFTNELDNPAYSSYNNIKLVKDQIITSFIDGFVDDLEKIVAPKAAPVVTTSTDPDKKIYIIEYNSPNQTEIPKDKLDQEECNRSNLWEYIASKNFTLIPRLDSDDDIDLSIAVQRHKEWLSISDGIIIYHGISDDDKWCRQQQTETFKAILELKRDKQGKDLTRAVFIDPMQENRQKGRYSFCDYSVIVNSPTELDAFLCKVQQH